MSDPKSSALADSARVLRRFIAQHAAGYENGAACTCALCVQARRALESAEQALA
jgi:hypothetical protein